ncbi:hypothetical protein AQUCO_01400818v1 [Aquilegia coerulea]|uniref:F-box associated beta-propeller type 3 domain-containing protein n=1 Tax=Aquilegia coerulea TaxID=218851 RepID=A0A2G5DYY9_AQUCA|nr:hypothetical protein AQUCO_01400818v1 [Aquilegia coerulea]
MSTFSCISWIPFLWGQVHGFFVQNATVDIPYEIIAEILSRLPAECVFLCVHKNTRLAALTTTPSYVDMHLSRANPVIAFQYYSLWVDDVNPVRSNVYFTGEVNKKTVTKSINIEFGQACRKTASLPFLYGSCNGFLLFRNLSFNPVLFILNPSTQEQVTVIAPHTGYRVRGFFFHSEAKEYRVLFVCQKGEGFEYFIISLRTKYTRQIISYSYPPSSLRNPILLNEVLHWKVDDKFYKDAHGVYPHCSNSILLFNTHTEKFATMSHPGGQCRCRGNHYSMKLMEKEGLLWLCDASSHEEIVVWVLEDYEKKNWVKRHVIIEPSKMFGVEKGSWESDAQVKAVQMYKDDILLSVSCRKLFLYNFQLGTFRRVVKKWRDWNMDMLVSPVYIS